MIYCKLYSNFDADSANHVYSRSLSSSAGLYKVKMLDISTIMCSKHHPSAQKVSYSLLKASKTHRRLEMLRRLTPHRKGHLLQPRSGLRESEALCSPLPRCIAPRLDRKRREVIIERALLGVVRHIRSRGCAPGRILWALPSETFRPVHGRAST